MDARGRPVSFAAGNRAYEDVQPQYKTVVGDKEDTLVVDLTGFKNEAEFKKEHLKIQLDNYGNLKISGERPLGGNRWSRFQKVYHLPEDCDASGVRATYDDLVLSVVMPKLVWDHPPAPAPAPVPAPHLAAAPREAAAWKPPTAAPAAPTAPAPAPAKVSAAAPAQQEPKLPAAVQGATAATAATAAAAPPSRRSEDGRSGGKTVPEKVKEQVGAPSDDKQKTAAADKKVAEPVADVAEKPPTQLPPLPAEKATPHVRKPPTVAAVEEEKPKLGTGGLDLGAMGRRPRQLLVNVLVAVMMLVALGFYLTYRYRGTPDGQQHPKSIKED